MALKKNLDQRIFDQMLDRIINGEWEQGFHLDVDELSQHYEVSRTPVLQALKRMHSEGLLIVTRVGKYYLPKYDEKQVRDICRVRLLIELEALDQIRSNKPDIDWSDLEKTASWCQKRTLQEDVVASRRYDMEWHKILVAASDNECLIGLYPKVQGQFMIANYLQTFHSNRQQLAAADDHAVIMQHLKQGDYNAAKEELTRHINAACEKIISRIPEGE